MGEPIISILGWRGTYSCKGLLIEVENIRCGGCANSIRKSLLEDERVSQVFVDIETGKISIESDGLSREEVTIKLEKMGYPEVGSVDGLKAATTKAKSFVSGAIGRIDM